jgi:hypothetical protein
MMQFGRCVRDETALDVSFESGWVEKLKKEENKYGKLK